MIRIVWYTALRERPLRFISVEAIIMTSSLYVLPDLDRKFETVESRKRQMQ